MNDEEIFYQMLAVLCTEYEKVLDPAIQNSWWQSLKRFSIQEIENAIHPVHPEQVNVF